MHRLMGFLIDLEISRPELGVELSTQQLSDIRDLQDIYQHNGYEQQLDDDNWSTPIAIITDRGDSVLLGGNKGSVWLADILGQPKKNRWAYARYAAMQSIISHMNPYVSQSPLSEFDSEKLDEHVIEFYKGALEVFNMELLLTLHNLSSAHIDGKRLTFDKDWVDQILSEQYGHILQFAYAAFKMIKDDEDELVLPNPQQAYMFNSVAELYHITVSALTYEKETFPFTEKWYSPYKDWGYFNMTNDYRKNVDNASKWMHGILYVDMHI